jgi:nicotinate phosphoribosyltransferase
MPNNCVFLVDTYDSLQGVRHAVAVGRRLRQRGHEMVGIRLDSGELGKLSIEARKILDEAGFPDAAIVASSDLDERVIARLKHQGATIGLWGVGTRLVTGHDQPALGGVYKLSAIRGSDGPWHDKVKLSEQAVKTSTPGILQVRRYRHGGRAIGDVIFDPRHPIQGDCVMVDLADDARQTTFPDGSESFDLLVPVFRNGERVYELPSLEEIRRRTQEQLGEFPPRVKRLADPEPYPVGLELGLHQHKRQLVLEERGGNR